MRKYLPLLLAFGGALALSCGSSRRDPDAPPEADGGQPATGGATSGTTGGVATEDGGAVGTSGAGRASAGAGGAAAGSGSAGAAGNDTSDTAGAAGMGVDPGVDIHGTVVDYTSQLPLSGRTVVVNGEEAKTDTDGAFTLPRPPGQYDLLILDADGASISVYQGLTRSAPHLAHFQLAVASPERREIIQGTLSGTLDFPLRMDQPQDIASVYLLSERGNARSLVGGGVPPFGPDYLAFLGWDGPAELEATLFAFATIADTGATRARYRAFAGSVPVMLVDGEMLTQDVALDEVPLGVVSGSARLPAGMAFSNYETFYRLPFPNAFLSFPNADVQGNHPLPTTTSFAFDVPNLVGSNAQLCVAVRAGGIEVVRTERCDVELDGAPVELELQSGPKLSAPDAGTPFLASTQFDWSPFVGGISILELTPDTVAAESPMIHVFTAQTTFSAQDLPIGRVKFGLSTYKAAVIGVGPFKDLDAAAGDHGFAAPVRRESRFARGPARTLVAAP